MDSQWTDRRQDVGDAARAHNRWPPVGLFAGLGLGAVAWLAVPQAPFWIKAVGSILAPCLGCLAGLAAAVLVHRRRH